MARRALILVEGGPWSIGLLFAQAPGIALLARWTTSPPLRGTMGYKHRAAAVDGMPRQWARGISPGGLRSEGRLDRSGSPEPLVACACPLAELPVREVVSAVHIVADLTLALGKVVHDYLADARRASLLERKNP